MEAAPWGTWKRGTGERCRGAVCFLSAALLDRGPRDPHRSTTSGCAPATTASLRRLVFTAIGEPATAVISAFGRLNPLKSVASTHSNLSPRPTQICRLDPLKSVASRDARAPAGESGMPARSPLCLRLYQMSLKKIQTRKEKTAQLYDVCVVPVPFPSRKGGWGWGGGGWTGRAASHPTARLGGEGS